MPRSGGWRSLRRQADLIRGLPQGYHTIVGEKGLGLSGGQKQRISIARALLKNAPVLVLDDASSALDLNTERKLMESIKTNYPERTLLIAAHRVSSIADCDEILYMQDGEIIERGTFEELIAMNGIFAEIYRMQTAEADADSEKGSADLSETALTMSEEGGRMSQRNTYFQDETVEKDKIDIKNLRRLMRYALPHKKLFIFVMVLLLIAVVSSVVSPLLLKYVINRAIPDRDYQLFFELLGGFILCGFTEIAISYVQTRGLGRMGHGIIASIRHDIFYKLQTLPFDYFDNRPSGKIVVRVTDYITELADFFITYMMNFILNIVKIVVVTVFMLVQSPFLTLVVYSAIVPLTAGVLIIRKTVRKLFRTSRAKASNRSAFIVESIMGEKIIQNYNRSEYNEEIYDKLQNDNCDTWMKIVRRNELNSPIVGIFWNYGTIMLYAIAFLMIPHGYFSDGPGTVIAFLSYMGLFSTPLMQLSAIIQNLSQVSANLERIFETIDTPNTIADREDSVELGEVHGQVDFNDVTFGYEEVSMC